MHQRKRLDWTWVFLCEPLSVYRTTLFFPQLGLVFYTSFLFRHVFCFYWFQNLFVPLEMPFWGFFLCRFVFTVCSSCVSLSVFSCVSIHHLPVISLFHVSALTKSFTGPSQNRSAFFDYRLCFWWASALDPSQIISSCSVPYGCNSCSDHSVVWLRWSV